MKKSVSQKTGTSKQCGWAVHTNLASFQYKRAQNDGKNEDEVGRCYKDHGLKFVCITPENALELAYSVPKQHTEMARKSD
jgi:hypothetical protein